MLYESPRFESIDIDDQEDWEFATIAARHLLDRQAGAAA
jgi:CMP-N-acetylneuraminic acid synthetase